MIKLEGITKAYTTGVNSVKVLKGIDLHIESGEMVAIMGVSGSGKSTLLNIMGLLDNYDSGQYFIGNKLLKNLNQLEAAHYRNQMFGFVFQSFNLIGFKNAVDNVALPLYYKDIRRKVRNKIAKGYLEKFGLAEREKHLPAEMSGGEKQRVAIARALVNRPEIIFTDEPTGALDSTTSAEVMDIFKQINSEGKTVILVTHEQSVAETAHRIIHIKDGIIT